MSDLYLIAAGLAVALLFLLVIGHYRGVIDRLRADVKYHEKRARHGWDVANDMWSKVLAFEAAETKRREQRLAK